MDPALAAKIQHLLDSHRIMTLATLRPDGWPQATTVGFLNEGMTLYFMCGRDSQKAHNIAFDNRVSLTIDHDTPDPMAITGLSMAAHAHLLTDPAEVRAKLTDLLPTKYPEYREMMGGLDLSGVLIFRVQPWIVSVLDYAKGFGHTDQVVLGG